MEQLQQPALLRPKQAAILLGVTVKTLRQWDRDGKLVADRTAGGHRRIKVEEVERIKCNVYTANSGYDPRRDPEALNVTLSDLLEDDVDSETRKMPDLASLFLEVE